jgi:dihydrofolate reductase
MGRIVVTDNISLDGVIEDPVGDEGFDRGGWVGLIRDRPELAQQALDEALRSEVMLLGRRTYEWFAGRWPSRTGPLADRLNAMPKVVVSSTLREPSWGNTTVLSGDVVAGVRRLREEHAGEIEVPASAHLVRVLLEHDLVDELRLKLFPVALGAGTRLFCETSGSLSWRLVDTRVLDGTTAFLTYERATRN